MLYLGFKLNFMRYKNLLRHSTGFPRLHNPVSQIGYLPFSEQIEEWTAD